MNAYCNLCAHASRYEYLKALPLKSISDQVKPVNGRRAKRMAAKDVAQAVELYRAGHTVYDLQTELGFHRETIAKALRAAGVRLRRGHLTKDEAVDAVRRYTAGESTAKIGRALGYSAQAVNNRLLKEAVTLRRPGRPARIVLPPPTAPPAEEVTE